ncbi:hypothetical protein Freya3_67 [Polaribacter phage Freya_3]|nr:hypothetical protein Freya2_67 [Polaribacter phage Freya_2]QQV91072.1 hypothetical protein Freya3_67 [Polaribacter phage Freya_3]QQV91140.1 hypothetical protein Freya4_67 [Polaribacter phage Freya_4]QQV91215.1 hypothetical protein Freya8_74 [Polaribacter phage Freya_8]QQV91292.1 hypothetical protein Freya9_76 [Polaribacter phage Freya_9]QQV91370.1 hypothetical protein Freya10_77 [Polaribacter phage Freya_10]QYV99949.1 hypothetical protein Freya5_69 [Polaribacter phage Freya_5]QYW00020.1 h
MNTYSKKEQNEQCTIPSVSSSLFDLTTSEKYTYLFKKVYENITHSGTGKLLISTHYCRKAAEILGGNYDELSKTGKDLFKSDIVDERLYVEAGFDKYMTY